MYITTSPALPLPLFTPPPLPTNTVLPLPWLSVVVSTQLLLLSVVIVILSHLVTLLLGLAAPDIVHHIVVGLVVATSLWCGGGGNLRDLRGDTWGYTSHGQRWEVLGSCSVLGWQETWDLHGGVFYAEWRTSTWQRVEVVAMGLHGGVAAADVGVRTCMVDFHVAKGGGGCNGLAWGEWRQWGGVAAADVGATVAVVQCGGIGTVTRALPAKGGIGVGRGLKGGLICSVERSLQIPTPVACGPPPWPMQEDQLQPRLQA
ncbi:hypothetical protein EDB83DRAFT_2316370 [Lactarius deliciosus]|nr:hypothetical protein EDB83DRAFT_2316370 [Lactarius deliciosus]